MDKKHGTYGGYTGGCRCDDCTRACRDYQRDRRQRSSLAREYDRWQRTTYNEAFGILRERHRTEFDAILATVRNSVKRVS